MRMGRRALHLRKPSYRTCVFVCAVLVGLGCFGGCAQYENRQMLVTAYSSDPISTNWRRGRLFFWRAYVASGPNKGKRKYVGITSSGSKASKGTIAADTRYYPYGTVMKVPGYGTGVVEDTGSAIKGPNRLDVYFSTRKKALEWGRQKLTVKVRQDD